MAIRSVLSFSILDSAFIQSHSPKFVLAMPNNLDLSHCDKKSDSIRRLAGVPSGCLMKCNHFIVYYELTSHSFKDSSF